MQQPQADAGKRRMEERTLAFNNIPVIGFLIGAQGLDGSGNKVSCDSIDGHPSARDQKSRFAPLRKNVP